MSRFNYKDNAVVKRTEVVRVYPIEDFPQVFNNHDTNRVQKVTAIRDAVRDSYAVRGYRDVTVRFANGIIADLVESGKQNGRPIPDCIFFEVELTMPLVESTVPVGRKDGDTNYHIYW